MSAERPFVVSVDNVDPDTSIVVVRGSVDMAVAAEFSAALTEAIEERDGSLLIDLTAVTFIDSTGLNALVNAFERQRWSGRGFAIVSDDNRLAMMLEVTRLDRVLKRYPTRDQALATLPEQNWP
jgi:anti-sigma B factor antagonist